jgi:hypothetical protein
MFLVPQNYRQDSIVNEPKLTDYLGAFVALPWWHNQASGGYLQQY